MWLGGVRHGRKSLIATCSEVVVVAEPRILTSILLSAFRWRKFLQEQLVIILDAILTTPHATLTPALTISVKHQR